MAVLVHRGLIQYFITHLPIRPSQTKIQKKGEGIFGIIHKDVRCDMSY